MRSFDEVYAELERMCDEVISRHPDISDAEPSPIDDDQADELHHTLLADRTEDGDLAALLIDEGEAE